MTRRPVDEFLTEMARAKHRVTAKPPPLKRCKHCGSMYCGIVCRFTMQPNTKEI